MNDAKVYLLFTNTGTMLTKLIQLYTKHSLNHVSIAFDEQLEELYSFGRKKPYNPFIGGFVKEQVNEGLMKHAECAVYSLSVSKEEFELMRAEVRRVEQQKEQMKYNLMGLFAIVFNHTWERDNAFFCSQFVATVLNRKKGLLNKVPCLITPQDIMGIERLQLMYEGKLSYYANPDEKMVHQLNYFKEVESVWHREKLAD